MTAGHPLTYKEDVHFKKLVDGVKIALTLNKTAELCMLAPSTFKDWVLQGRKDLSMGLDTPLAKLSANIRAEQSKKAINLMNEIQESPERWQALAWILERCFREDFGADAGIIQELKEKFEELERKMEK